MASSHVQVAPDGAGKDVDAQSLTSDEAGTPTVYRQVTVLGDPTTYANKMAVKAGSTAAAAGDPSAVVALSPNSALPAGTNVIGHAIVDSGTITTVSTVTAVTAITNALPAGTNLIGHVDVDAITPPTLTKGTQSSTGFSVQQLHDSGRTFITFTVDAAVGTTATTLATMSINKAGAVTSSTNYTVTAGKTLRIQNFSLAVKQTNATMNNSRAYLNATASGTVATSSPVVDSLIVAAPVATTNAVGVVDANLAEGVELPAATNLGMSHIEVATTASVYISINAYEY
jgi:hypothetical protein